MTEVERRRFVDEKRMNTPCSFRDGILREEFVSLVEKAVKKTDRIRTYEIKDAVIFGVAESQTGQSTWNFRVDFNNWGHITGVRWTWAENQDSNLPEHFGDVLAAEIRKLLKERNISLPDYSEFIDENAILGTERGLSYYKGRSIFEKEKAICVNHDSSSFKGEHLYYVFSVLIKNGFSNIKAVLVDDIGKKSDNYVNEVEQVLIGETTFFEKGDMFGDRDEVVIIYHEKKGKKTYVSKAEKRKRRAKKYRKLIIVLSIVLLLGITSLLIYAERQCHIPISVDSEDLIGRNYQEVMDELYDAGFLLVSSSAEYTLGIDEIDKDDTVYEVQVGDDTSFESDDIYRENVKIVVKYRTLERIPIPLSSEEMKGQDYKEIETALKEAGFVNINYNIEYDLVFGIFKKDGIIESVTINGNEEFNAGYNYRPDCEIVITYHTYSKNDPNK